METLAERIGREGPVNELDAVGWIVRLAKKLESMHSRGLAHGGVSPEAMKTASASRLSLGMLIPTGSARNRNEFRSPERIDGAGASPTDDTWATAATLYALITGSSPFAATDEDTVRKKVRAGVFAPLSTFDVGDDDLQNIIELALRPTLAHRTSSMTAFREALEGWHPDSKVRELPPMVDDQLEDDDEDARTVMRPVSAADAVRALLAQREQAAARASEPPQQAPAPVKETASRSNESAARAAAPAPAAKAAVSNHGLLEDDDENAKTSMISVPPLAYLGSRAPATVPAPPPTDMNMKSTPPPGAQSTGFGVMRGSNAPATRGALAKSTVVGGFTAKQVIEQQQQMQKQAPPVAAPAPIAGISRDAVIDDVDGEATVMREAPIDVLRKAKPSIAPAADRKTPVDPISAAVAATTAAAPKSASVETNPAPETSMSFGAISLIEDVSEAGAAVQPRETPVSPSKGLKVQDLLAGPAAASVPAGQTPMPAAAARISTPGLATSSLTAPSTPGMAAPSTPGMHAPSNPGVAPAPLAAQPTQAAPVAAPAAVEQAQPSALKGLFIGVGLALLIIAAAAAAYFFVVKH